ncbi:aminodeoxychorismate synthase component I [Emcibacter sp.]|uniref:aminodeoxychorismate synthase component I n=1 Tax=Emcibacter sp. TaxID=1979954 RepID=UPI002AA709F9|nr:aminodeoxychorismate synthase component I [Emcibacter sp.]
MPEKKSAGKNQEFTVFLDNSLDLFTGQVSYVYDTPDEVITARTPAELTDAFEHMEKVLDAGKHLAGYISYETGLALEHCLEGLLPAKADVPYLCFGVYGERKTLTASDAGEYWRTGDGMRDPEVDNLQLNISRDEYLQDIERIQEYLQAGDVYQVNYTLKALFDYAGPSKALYSRLRRAQPVSYGAYISSDELDVLSFSPELFLKKQADVVVMKPMKGTIRRGHTLEEDRDLAAFMREDEKSRAENLMIVDLIRNDLSKLAEPGSVQVDSLFDIEKYRTLLQMTSTVKARLGDHVKVTDLLKSMFPCGSVTGAPKIRAMEIIHELERGPRGIYTGAIGYITPDRDLCFNVPIRTLVLDRAGRGCLGIGGGIVADSVAGEEYEECLLKASFLTRKQPTFDLLETIGWSGEEGFKLLDLHLDRLKKSAEYFDFRFDRDEIRKDLERTAEYLAPETEWRIRLLLSRVGNWSVTCEKQAGGQVGEVPQICLSDRRTDSRNSLFYHKTTARDFYNEELAKARQDGGCFEVIFQNENCELTEGSFTNLFVELDGQLFTPPVSAGLLAGTLRQDLLEQGRAIEKTLWPEDLLRAEKIFVGNSVRGLLQVKLKNPPQG